MGVMAYSLLKPQKQNDLTVNMFVRSDPPESCTVDGVQVGSGCTVGKGTIRISRSRNRIAGQFHSVDRACTITVKPQVLNALLGDLMKATDKQILEMAEGVLSRPDDELFQITSFP
jgi:formylmethanofuran dehydrogenase subunit E